MARGGRRGLGHLGMLRIDRRTGIVAPPYPARMARALLDRHYRPLGVKGHQTEFGRRKKISSRILGIFDPNGFTTTRWPIELSGLTCTLRSSAAT